MKKWLSLNNQNEKSVIYQITKMRDFFFDILNNQNEIGHLLNNQNAKLVIYWLFIK